MARINIEDSLFKDPDFLKLIAKVGNYYEALGLVISCFQLAQKYWIEHKCIPEDKWHKDFEPLVEVGLAERTFGARSVKVRGSEKQFSWLVQKSNAGKKSSINNQKNLKQHRTGTERPLNAAEPPFSLLSSLCSSSVVVEEKKTYFEEFCRQKLNASLDTGFEMYALKAYKCWPTEDAFFDFVSVLYESKGFKKILKPQQQDRYIKTAIISEINNRGIK